ncbi:MAG: glycosyltransferase family 39 protein, partial [bacterium]
MSSSRHSWMWFIPFALIFSLQVVPRFAEDSPTADEVVNISDGYYYWKGDVVSDARHPPLAKGLQAFPLWFLGLDTHTRKAFADSAHRDYNFFFKLNPNRFTEMTACARMVTFLGGLGIGVLLFLIGRRESSAFLCVALWLWAFSPALLAFSGFSLSDIPLTVFFLAAVWWFNRSLEEPGAGPAGAAGFFSGMAILSKFSGVLLLPIFILLELGSALGRKKISGDWGRLARRWAVGLSVLAGMIFLTYLPGTLWMDHRSPFVYFWKGFWAMEGLRGWPNYFRGILSTKYSLTYYPTAFLIKSPLSFLILLLSAMGLKIVRKIKVPLWHWLPPVVFFGAIMPFQDLGIREILPIYPFLILVAARAGEWMWNRRPRESWIFPVLLVGLLLFQGLSVG